MFRKPFSFLKKSESRDDADKKIPHQVDEGILKTLSPCSTNERTSSPDSSPVSSKCRDIKARDRQFSSSPDVYSQPAEAPDQDPLGLKVLYTPGRKRKVDVIFVHGVGGSSRMTWSKNRNLELFWPLKFLPFEPDINEARILTFGYNANFRPGSGKTKSSILDFAKDLLYDLKYANDESTLESNDLGMGEQPIIFVVHSMGGLIVKEAYIRGQNDPTYRGIIRSISSIIFLSTPHRGTNLAEALNRILQVSFVANPMQFITDLAKNSSTLQRLNEDFRHVAPNIQIVSFYETRPTTMFRTTQLMVLEKDSSILGYPGEISKPLDADHHSICKYESPHDPLYITVRNVLRSLVRNAKAGSQPDASQVSNFVNFEEYLAVTELPCEDYNFFRHRWTPGTCNWILAHGSFTSWLEDVNRRPRILWIHGDAGSGKSILASFVIDHLFQQGLPCHYFFIRFNDQKKKGLSMILRSLACQIARSTPGYADKLRLLETVATDLRTADFRSIWQWLYKQSLFQLDICRPLYWVIDGVDEADSPASVVKLLSDLHPISIPLRVLIVSRKTHEISSAFQKLGKQMPVEVIYTEGNRDDFRCYIDQEMDVVCEESYRDEVVAELLERACGNFLWIHLAVGKINRCHTKAAVEDALKYLPLGMEILYDRMAASIQAQPNVDDRALGQNILGWVTCAQRLLDVEELSDVLDNDGLLDIHRTIGDLCAGFVVVNTEGRVTMIHETAREYLMRSGGRAQPFFIDRKTTNDKLFKRCMLCLTDPNLRNRIRRNQLPALLSYATCSWFIHLSLGTVTHPDILDTVVKFLRGASVLTWISIAARRKELSVLAVASRYLSHVSHKLRSLNQEESLAHRQALDVIENWATDLIKVVGKFGKGLSQNPDSIYNLVPPFCPVDSILYQQFGHKNAKALKVSGFRGNSWDDCLARFSLEKGFMTSAIMATGSRILLLATRQTFSQVVIYSSVTFEEQRRIIHPERVSKVQVNDFGDLLVTYGFMTTRVWDMATGQCIKTVKNPKKLPDPHTLQFTENGKTLLVGTEERCIRSLSLESDSIEWQIKARIHEPMLVGTIVNFPKCSALSPDGKMIAYGYRGHPATVWKLDPPTLLGHCFINLDPTDMTRQKITWGEVFELSWHPSAESVFGLTQVGLLFKWDPYEEETSTKVESGGANLTVSRDGSLVATGDPIGKIKVYASEDLSLLYQLSSRDPVLQLSFSTDSRRLYDIRGVYGNIWEPNILVRLADNPEYPDHNSNTLSEAESLAKISLNVGHQFVYSSTVVALSGQPAGQLYCCGTDDGIAVLCDIASGKVCELQRVPRHMRVRLAAWSKDGTLLALLDDCRNLSVRRIAVDQNPPSWEVKHEFDLMMPRHGNDGRIRQLFFHPGGHELFAASPTALYRVILDSQSLVMSTLPPEMSTAKWMCHPTLFDYLLGFGTTRLHILSCMELREIQFYTYYPPRIRVEDPEATCLSQTFQNRDEFNSGDEEVGRLVSSVNSPFILLKISSLALTSQFESQYLVFTITDIYPNGTSDNIDVRGRELPYTLLPANIASRIREPLGFLSCGKLIFLDIDQWVCALHVPSLVAMQSQTEISWVSVSVEVEQYYFLPGDWVPAHETHLCTVMLDGTLLCPWNQDIITVQSAKLR